MATIRCGKEHASFPEGEFREFGGVLVHAVGAWHLINGDDIEMHGLGRPVIQSGRPVVDVGTFAPAPAPSEVVGEFDTAYRPGHENE